MLSDELYHHGVKGMKWGVRHEYKAKGRKRSKKTDDKNKKHLTDKQKRAIKIGAAVVGTALVTYGAYKLGKSGVLDKHIKTGKSVIGDLGIIDSNSSGFKKMSKTESLAQRVKNVNPLKGTAEGKNNCTYCSIGTYMRGLGYDVTAKSTGGKMQDLAGIVEHGFSGAKVIDGSAVRFGKSTEDASQMLVKRFGENAEGVCSVNFKKGGGHAFNWKTVSGKASFFDGQQGIEDASFLWQHIDPTGRLVLARLDNATPDLEKLADYIENRK